MPRFAALLFDLGSTLIYFDGDWPTVSGAADAAMVKALQSAGLALDWPAFLNEFRRRQEAYFVQRETEFIEYTTAYLLQTLLADLGQPDLPDQTLRPALEALYAVSQAHWQPEADAVPTLASLQAQGYRLGLISNAGDDDDVQRLVDRSNFRPYFDFIISSAAVGIRKPNPRIFQIALERWNLPPSRVAMIGDTLGADILGAKNAGVYAIWITRRADTPANRDHEDTIQPDAVIHQLSDLNSLLQP